MPDHPKRVMPDLKVVDENYEGPAPNIAAAAACIREGRRRQKAVQANAIAELQFRHEGVVSTHAQALQDSKRAAYKHGLHKGIWLGIIPGAVISLAVGAMWMLVGADMFGRNATTGSMIARQADNVRLLEQQDRAP